MRFLKYPLPTEITRLRRSIEERQHSLENIDVSTDQSSHEETLSKDLALLRAKLTSAIKRHSFELKPSTRTCNFKVTPHDSATTTMKMSAKFTQIPVNSSDAITGHKLQGLTKDSLVVYEWDSDTCWIYVVLSRVRTLKGLYLIRPIRRSDIKPARREYLDFMVRMETLANLEVERFRTFHRRMN